ncbi:MAG TPA: FHA domain-containing protein [Pedococcus sp.]|nr:FHA domain-containing protein [Pedococcus sp.]
MSSPHDGPRSGPSRDPAPWGQVEVHAGSGLVFRRHAVLLVVPDLPPGRLEKAAELMRICAERGGPRDLRHIRRLAWVITEDDSDGVPGFACLTAQGEHVLVMAHGEVRITVQDHPPVVFTGTESVAWVERSVPTTFTTLSVESTAGAPEPVRSTLRLDLLDGAVPGAGVTVHRRIAVEPNPVTPALPVGLLEEEPAVEPPLVRLPSPGRGADLDPGQARTVLRATPGTQVVSLTPRPPEASRVRPPLPLGTAGQVTSEPGRTAGDLGVPVAAAHVAGIVCLCGEFNSPDSVECQVCGAPLDRDGPRETRLRPPLGILITDDGRVFTVTDDIVIGREPGQAPEVKTGRARPLVLRDAEHSTSRVHAQIRLAGWSIQVLDRGSANGTFLSRSGSGGPWVPVVPEPGTPLAPGDRLRLGNRELLFDRYQAK